MAIWLCEVGLRRHVVVKAENFGEAVEKLKRHVEQRKVYVRLDQKEEVEDPEYEGYIDAAHMKELT